MKQVLAFIALAAFSCNNAPDKEALNMAGAYSMVSQSIKSPIVPVGAKGGLSSSNRRKRAGAKRICKKASNAIKF